jgi:zinc transport system substrate-binding protein
MYKKLSLALTAFSLLFVFSCGNKTEVNKNLVYVSIEPQKYIVDRIVDTLLKVEVLLPQGANHETFEPTAKQLRALSSSSLYLSIGLLDFERSLLDKLKSQNTATEFVNLSEGLSLLEGACSHGHDHGNDHGHSHGTDPHVWLSAVEMAKMTRTIQQNLSEKYPQYDSIFTANASTLLIEIDSLHRFMQKRFEATSTRKFIIFHPAFAYLARDYSIEQLALEEEGKSPSISHMKNVLTQAKSEGIKTIFIQKEFDTAIATVAATDFGGKVVVINPLEYSWLENMYAMSEMLGKALNGE